MKRIYTIVVALLSVCYMSAQDRIYVHKSNGKVDLFMLSQLDSLSFASSDSELRLSAEKDTIRVGESVSLQTNILDGSMMDVAWRTRDWEVVRVSGSYDQATVLGLSPGQALVQAACDGLVTNYPITVIGKTTSTGAPITHWDVVNTYVQSGENVSFVAQYDSKDSPVDYTSVWYDLEEVTEKRAVCSLIKDFHYEYALAERRVIHEKEEKHKYVHDSNSWSDSTQSYIHVGQFPVVLDDTLSAVEWNNPRDTTSVVSKIKSYLGENFLSKFKDGVKSMLNPSENERNYAAYMNVFDGLGLLDGNMVTSNGDTMSYKQWMTDSVFNENTNMWIKVFKQYDSIWSKTNFDTLGVVIDSFEQYINMGGRPPKFDTVMVYDTTLIIKPWLEEVRYVYPEILARIDRTWNDSVSYMNLLLGSTGYTIEYNKTYQVNAEYHVYDKSGNIKTTEPVSVEIGNTVEKVKIMAAADPIIARETSVALQVGNYFTARQGTKQYRWLFPDGTLNATTQEAIGKFEGAAPPALVFSHVGGHSITLQVTINGVRLPDEVFVIKVGYNQAVPTLYYATAQGSVMAYKLTNGSQPIDVSVDPYDLGFYTQHAFNLHFKDSLLYVLDAGKQFYYVEDTYSVLGDGKISVLSKDGSKVETMISNVGQAAFDDPFYGYIDDDFLYYANRSTGIIKVPLKDRDKVYSMYEYPYYVRHNTLNYFGVGGLAYSAISRNFAKIEDVWHWSTCHTATATFCFQEHDILPEPITLGDKYNLPEEGKICDGVKLGSFCYSKKHDKVVFCAMGTAANCIAACTYAEWKAMISEGDIQKKEVKFNNMSFASNLSGNLPALEGIGVESVGITQIAYDDINECFYFAYRNNSERMYLYPPTGIYCYSIRTNTVTCLIEGVEAYGLTVNNTPSKLF